jgi:NADH:ubiquinone oxidoreductase subunit 2 (subunit N)
MLLLALLTIIIFSTLPGLNKIKTEINLATNGTTKTEPKLSYIIYTRIAAVVLLLIGLVSVQVLGLPEIGEGLSIYNGLFQVTQVSLFIEIFIVIVGALILVAWPGIPLLNQTESKLSSNQTANSLNKDSGANASNLYSLHEQVEEPKGHPDFEPFINSGVGYSSVYHYADILKADNSKEPSGNTLALAGTTVNLINYYQNYLDKSKDYAMIIFFNLFGALLLISSFDLVSLYLSIELQSFALYILATFYKESRIVTAAGLKYFLLGALSSCFILLGSALIYAFSGLTKFDSIYCLMSSLNPYEIHTQLTFGVILIIIGFLFKIGAAPLHNWAPDVYNDNPTIVTIWLTIMPKLSILILLLELYLQTHLIVWQDISWLLEPIEFTATQSFADFVSDAVNTFIKEIYEPYGGLVILKPEESTQLFQKLTEEVLINESLLFENWITITTEARNFIQEWRSLEVLDTEVYNLLAICSLLSLIIGTVLGLGQSQIKRLMAYSTIGHLGFILLALDINTEQAIDSFLFYIIQYTLTNLNVFLIIIAFNYLLCSLVKNNLVIKDIKYISELTNQYNKNPILTISFIICLLSMAGRICPMFYFYVLFSLLSLPCMFYSAYSNRTPTPIFVPTCVFRTLVGLTQPREMGKCRSAEEAIVRTVYPTDCCFNIQTLLNVRAG